MSLCLPVTQRLFMTRAFSRCIGSEPIKFALPVGTGSYSVNKLATDSIGNFSLSLTNVVVGSRWSIEANSVQIQTGVAASSTVALTIPAYSPGSASNDLKIKVRKATATPFYRPYDTQTTASVGSASIYVSQQSDE